MRSAWAITYCGGWRKRLTALMTGLTKGDKAVEKADEHYKAAGIYLKELKAEHADTWAKWKRCSKPRSALAPAALLS